MGEWYRLILVQIIISMKRETIRKTASFSSLHPASTAPQQFRQLNKTLLRPKQSKQREGSFTDSDSSDSVCMEKKFYRCGCLSQHGCNHHQYRDYLSEMRAARLKRERASEVLDFSLDKGSLSLSDTEKEEENVDTRKAGSVSTPKKEEGLERIMEINESAEYSKRKNFNSITITLQGKKYYKTFTSREEVLHCFSLIQSMLE